mmetsp:Transcript_29106/g.89154  ORF Transcript_29106/g.89154 Transcript_29106/m.89154 type:complete len:108 (-) Transcript_29106:96-419(-)|eukprot:scaffold51732_cov31-Tisochrysis_lutea.AAC.1
MIRPREPLLLGPCEGNTHVQAQLHGRCRNASAKITLRWPSANELLAVRVQTICRDELVSKQFRLDDERVERGAAPSPSAAPPGGSIRPASNALSVRMLHVDTAFDEA